mmetsp:Transcript_1406/g.148  ORF Transcript_1406/g.148 Transcript_1406/m.148 type:complete len:107 (-) Transcript_1406:56-376(-)
MKKKKKKKMYLIKKLILDMVHIIVSMVLQVLVVNMDKNQHMQQNKGVLLVVVQHHYLETLEVVLQIKVLQHKIKNKVVQVLHQKHLDNLQKHLHISQKLQPNLNIE